MKKDASAAPQTADIEISEFKFLEPGADVEEGEFVGYGSVFGVVDSGGDVIERGAFATSISEKGAGGIAMLYQHDPSEPIGVWTEMVEDERGLRVRGRLALETTRGREVRSLLKMGALNGLSIGFRIVDAQPGATESERRRIKSADLWEVSIVTFPMNRESRVSGVKDADVWTPTRAERALKAAGMPGALARKLVAGGKALAFGEQRDAGATDAERRDAGRKNRTLEFLRLLRNEMNEVRQ